MLKMMGKGTNEDGKPLTLIVFGLSDMNLVKLREGKPIKFNGATCGLSEEIEFVIFNGTDERTMQRDFESFVGPETKLRIDPRLKD
jgi:hypothetical protein